MVFDHLGAWRHWHHERTSLAPSIFNRAYTGRHSLNGENLQKMSLSLRTLDQTSLELRAERMIFSLVREFIWTETDWLGVSGGNTIACTRPKAGLRKPHVLLIRQDFNDG